MQVALGHTASLDGMNSATELRGVALGAYRQQDPNPLKYPQRPPPPKTQMISRGTHTPKTQRNPIRIPHPCQKKNPHFCGVLFYLFCIIYLPHHEGGFPYCPLAILLSALPAFCAWRSAACFSELVNGLPCACALVSISPTFLAPSLPYIDSPPRRSAAASHILICSSLFISVSFCVFINREKGVTINEQSKKTRDTAQNVFFG